MRKFSFSYSLLLYTFHILSDFYPNYILANKCDIDLFELPYVHVKRKRNGGNIASLHSTGFLNLREKTRVILCINGPVVMYSSYEDIGPIITTHHEKRPKKKKELSLKKEQSEMKDNSGITERSEMKDNSEITERPEMKDNSEITERPEMKENSELSEKKEPSEKKEQSETTEKSERTKRDAITTTNPPEIAAADPSQKVADDPSQKAANDPSQKAADDPSQKAADDPSQKVANESNATSPPSGTRYKNGTFAVFNHECFSINRIPMNILKLMQKQTGQRNPEIFPKSEVQGRLLMGIFLIGNKNGYNEKDFAWFEGPNFEYIDGGENNVVNDSSFILTGNKTKFCTKLPNGRRIVVKASDEEPDSNGPQVYCWTHKNLADNKTYLEMFRNGFKKSDYDWYDCTGSDDASDIIIETSKTTPAPISHVNYTEFDPFSIFNPNEWTPHGYRRNTDGLTGGDEREEDKSLKNGSHDPFKDDPCTLDPWNPPCQNIKEDTDKDMQNVDLEGTKNGDSSSGYVLKAGGCEKLPVFDNDSCVPGKNGNRLLEIVLELVPDAIANNTPPPTEPKEFPKFKNLNDDPDLAWKFDFLYKVSDIFTHLCMPFRPEMPYQVARVFAWYVYKAHMYGDGMGSRPTSFTPGSGRKKRSPQGPDPAPELSEQFDPVKNKTQPWPILFNELDRCQIVVKKDNNGNGLEFKWDAAAGMQGQVRPLHGKGSRRKKRSVILQRPVRQAINPEDEGSMFEKYLEIDPVQDDDENGEDMNRERRARPYKINGSLISTKHILPGKSLASVKAEGVNGFARELVQEYRNNSKDYTKYEEYPEDIEYCMDHAKCSTVEDIFFYEDKAEIQYELNIAIDLWWKIWGTVLGYCNKAYNLRKADTFFRLYNGMTDHFLDLVEQEWLYPTDNDDLRVIFSEYLTEPNLLWMDACMEGAYLNSKSHSFRPPRPIMMGEDDNKTANYFEELPPFLYYRYHKDPGHMNFTKKRLDPTILKYCFRGFNCTGDPGWDKIENKPEHLDSKEVEWIID